MAQAKDLHLQVDPHSGLPVYRQIMDQFKYYIASATLKAGDQLPSIRELAHNLSVNPTTIVKAYTELEHERAIEMRPGKGAYVAEAAQRMSSFERSETLRRAARQLAVEAAQLGAQSDEVLRLVSEELHQLHREPAIGPWTEATRKQAHG